MQTFGEGGVLLTACVHVMLREVLREAMCGGRRRRAEYDVEPTVLHLQRRKRRCACGVNSRERDGRLHNRWEWEGVANFWTLGI